MEVFNSKVDTWLAVILLGSAALCAVAAIATATRGGTGNVVIGTALLLLGAGFPLWLFLATKYVVSANELVARSGPFSWTVEIDSITSVSDSRNPLSSPALSLDRLEIKHGNRKTILVSPADKQAFRNAIGHPE